MRKNKSNPSPAAPPAAHVADDHLPAYHAFCAARMAPTLVHSLEWALLAEDLRQAARDVARCTLTRVLLLCAHEAQTRSEG
jgi:hypothetical protein